MTDKTFHCRECDQTTPYDETRKKRDPRFPKAFRSICESCWENVTTPKAPDFNVGGNFKKAGTSSQAAQAAAESARLGDTHLKIGWLLHARHMTGDECHQAWLDAGHPNTALNTIRARMTDLFNQGLIAPTGKTRPTQYKKQAAEMELTGSGMDWLQAEEARAA